MTGYWANIEDGTVVQVRRVSKEYLLDNPNIYQGVWKEVTDMQQYPSVGWTWAEQDGFRSIRPYPSWLWEDTTRTWTPPKPYPKDGQDYVWDEASHEWISP